MSAQSLRTSYAFRSMKLPGSPPSNVILRQKLSQKCHMQSAFTASCVLKLLYFEPHKVGRVPWAQQQLGFAAKAWHLAVSALFLQVLSKLFLTSGLHLFAELLLPGMPIYSTESLVACFSMSMFAASDITAKCSANQTWSLFPFSTLQLQSILWWLYWFHWHLKQLESTLPSGTSHIQKGNGKTAFIIPVSSRMLSHVVTPVPSQGSTWFQGQLEETPKHKWQ